MPACYATDERGAGAAQIVDGNFWSLGRTKLEKCERLLWLMQLDQGLTGNEVVREAERFAREQGERNDLTRNVALRKLYHVRETPEFQERFAQYMRG